MNPTEKPSPDDDAAMPRCPITGQPARRLIQKIPLKLLRLLWRFGLGIDIRRSLHGLRGIGLYESPCGLVYFSPAIAGDEAFYDAFYSRVGMHELLNAHGAERAEFIAAARHAASGARILDVGCGRGGFAEHVPNAEYHGLDPYAPTDADPRIIRARLEDHASLYPGHYDLVTAFQVIEHLPDPLGFAGAMLKTLKPGGLLILCAPLHPSATTAIPNFLLNAPPHHLSWWNREAFAALAETLGLELIELEELPASPHEGLIHWMHRLNPCAGRNGTERYFAHRWAWHLATAWSFAAGRLASRIRPLPARAGRIGVFLAARKPA
ncbi:MAG: class I SAM-dependent methyltransferase [Methylotetracoccus sp.]